LTLTDNSGKRIDYIWFSPRSLNAAASAIRGVEVLKFIDAEVPEDSLSDHAGVACTIELQ
jgi:exonuclease III